MAAPGRTPPEAAGPLGPARAPLRPGATEFMAGERASFKADLSPFLPQDLVGGSIPHVPGTENEGVWNAAAQACSTERVSYCYTVEGGRCWYLACPSSALASNPDSWCPLAAALPGNSEYWDRETVYLYEQEGLASALRWDAESGRMQVYLGAARTLLPRIQSMDANFVTINPDVATLVPWRNRALRTEQLSRATVNALTYGGLLVAGSALLLLVFSFIATNFVRRDLASVHAASDDAATDLLVKANAALQSDTIRHMVRVQELLGELEKRRRYTRPLPGNQRSCGVGGAGAAVLHHRPGAVARRPCPARPGTGRPRPDQGGRLMKFDLKPADFKKIEWRSLQRLFSPQAANDLNSFLERLPGNVGQTPIITAGVAWGIAALIGVFSFVQAKNLTAMRAELHETKALKPTVPVMIDKPLGSGDLKDFVANLSTLYPDLVIKQAGTIVSVTAKSTANFGEFREAVEEVQNGGANWRVTVNDFCVGRECAHDQLSASLKVSKVSVDKPQ